MVLVFSLIVTGSLYAQNRYDFPSFTDFKECSPLAVDANGPLKGKVRKFIYKKYIAEKRFGEWEKGGIKDIKIVELDSIGMYYAGYAGRRETLIQLRFQRIAIKDYLYQK